MVVSGSLCVMCVNVLMCVLVFVGSVLMIDVYMLLLRLIMRLIDVVWVVVLM